jgi:hypothetical protein
VLNVKNKNLENAIVDELCDNGFCIARLLSGSKSSYHDRYPRNAVFFNANVVDKKLGKIWHGDLDLTRDGEKLKCIAKQFDTTFYILREMDGRFENEGLSVKKLISKAKWNTDMFIPVYDDKYEMVPIDSEKDN